MGLLALKVVFDGGGPSLHYTLLTKLCWTKNICEEKKHFQGHVDLKFLKKKIQGFNYDFHPLYHFKWLSKERNNCTATGSLERKTESNYDYHNYYYYPIIIITIP